MIAPVLLKLAMGFSVVMTGAGVVLMRGFEKQRRMNARLAQVRDGRPSGSAAANQGGSGLAALVRMISNLGQTVLRSGIVSSQTVAELERSLERAGIRGGNAVAVFISCKLILAVTLPLMLFVLVHDAISRTVIRNMLMGGAAVLGLIGPDYIVRSLRKRYQGAVSAGLPDALDMLVMCAELGLSLEPAITRVGMEIQQAHPQIAGELLMTANEFQISPDSTAVLNAFAERTGLPDVKRVVGTLAQTLQYGTPLAEALRVLSAEMRQELLTKFEERAARLPVLLTLPMIVFILPSLFLVVGGPAILQALRMFKGM